MMHKTQDVIEFLATWVLRKFNSLMGIHPSTSLTALKAQAYMHCVNGNSLVTQIPNIVLCKLLEHRVSGDIILVLCSLAKIFQQGLK